MQLNRRASAGITPDEYQHLSILIWMATNTTEGNCFPFAEPDRPAIARKEMSPHTNMETDQSQRVTTVTIRESSAKPVPREHLIEAEGEKGVVLGRLTMPVPLRHQNVD
jgi:hypothetical protein